MFISLESRIAASVCLEQLYFNPIKNRIVCLTKICRNLWTDK
ncbi:hypothetical protein HNQ03_002269 [Chryseobacterium sp. 16F]|uniref:Uncharacterized protein n=1 Tax=Frigoriflavimonas asaccharolytica TaxID=2735899 RepID=A0A8J8K9L2_9FLAO|nr:hypothetical protein [Frigoriflavimonas asaccharolytica]